MDGTNSRVEELLTTGSEESLHPMSRIEKILKDGGGGGSSSGIIEEVLFFNENETMNLTYVDLPGNIKKYDYIYSRKILIYNSQYQYLEYNHYKHITGI